MHLWVQAICPHLFFLPANSTLGVISGNLGYLFSHLLWRNPYLASTATIYEEVAKVALNRFQLFTKKRAPSERVRKHCNGESRTTKRYASSFEVMTHHPQRLFKDASQVLVLLLSLRSIEEWSGLNELEIHAIGMGFKVTSIWHSPCTWQFFLIEVFCYNSWFIEQWPHARSFLVYGLTYHNMTCQKRPLKPPHLSLRFPLAGAAYKSHHVCIYYYVRN